MKKLNKQQLVQKSKNTEKSRKTTEMCEMSFKTRILIKKKKWLIKY